MRKVIRTQSVEREPAIGDEIVAAMDLVKPFEDGETIYEGTPGKIVDIQLGGYIFVVIFEGHEGNKGVTSRDIYLKG